MPNKSDHAKGSAQEIAEAEAKQLPLEAIKAEELGETGGHASDDPIADLMDEGRPTGHPGGQLRGDQTDGHRGGSQRQTLNRGRD
jgi:hypothetical protein